MRVSHLHIKDFRNFDTLHTDLSPGVNILYGDNAQGKTNFLEAVYFCATGRSQRAGSDRELIRFGQREAHLRAEIVREGEDVRVIDAHIQQNESRSVKGIAIDHLPVKKLNELFGLLLVVIFSPEDLRLIKAGPAERRAFMDMELCQLSPVYYHELRQYHHALKQRNHLLKSMQTNPKLADTVFVWDEQLCRYGRRIMSFRSAFVRKAGELAADMHARMTGGTEQLAMQYRPHIVNPDDYEEKLKKTLPRDIALGSTGSGAHRDDILFTVNGADARMYGSQGQQRTAALSAKLAEIDIIREETHREPVLLLDDVLSELDEHRQAFLLSRMGPAQTLLTCTGVEDLITKNAPRGDVRILRMENGVLYDA